MPSSYVPSSALGTTIEPSEMTLGAGVGTGILSRPLFATSEGGTLTLDVASAATIKWPSTYNGGYIYLPDTSTLVAGWAVTIINNAATGGPPAGIVTIKTHQGALEVFQLANGYSVMLICNSIASNGVAAWDVVSPLEFTAKLAADQSLAFNVDETLVFQGAVGSLASALNGATGVFTAPKAGTVVLSGVVHYSISGSAETDMFGSVAYSKNAGATQDIGSVYFLAAAAGARACVAFSLPLSVATGDTVEIVAHLEDNSGGGTLLAASYSGWTVKYV